MTSNKIRTVISDNKWNTNANSVSINDNDRRETVQSRNS